MDKRLSHMLVRLGLVNGLGFAALGLLIDALSYTDYAYLGIKGNKAQQLAIDTFLPQIIAAVAKLLAVYAVFFILHGIVARLIHAVVIGGRTPRRILGETFLIQAGMHLIAFFYAANHRPQLFTAWFDRWRLDWLLRGVATSAGRNTLNTLIAVATLAVLWRVWQRHRVRIPRAAVVAAVALLMAITTAWVAYPFGPLSAGANETAAHPKHVVLISVDSLRVDRLAVDENKTSPMPFVSDLVRRKGMYFPNTYVPLARTFPSWAALMTSTHPKTNGVRSSMPSVQSRREAPVTLPQILNDNGFYTAAYSDYAGDIFTRYPFGFTDVRAPRFTFVELIRQRTVEAATQFLPYVLNRVGMWIFPGTRGFAQAARANVLVDEFLAGLRHHAGERTFSTLFFSDSHFPYATPYPGYLRYRVPGYDGANQYICVGASYVDPASNTPEDVRQINGLYDGGLWTIDGQIKRLVAGIEALGLGKQTLIVLTADHGENLGEGRLGFGHGDHLFGDHGLRVPLAFIDLGNTRHGVNRRQVRSLEMAPTLLSLLNIPAPASFKGEDLLRADADDTPLPTPMETGLWFLSQSKELHQSMRLFYPDIVEIGRVNRDYHSEIEIGEDYRPTVTLAKHLGWQRGNERLVYIPMQPTPRWQLFDLAQDPNCENDLAGEKPERLRALRDEMVAAMGELGTVSERDSFLHWE